MYQPPVFALWTHRRGINDAPTLHQSEWHDVMATLPPSSRIRSHPSTTVAAAAWSGDLDREAASLTPVADDEALDPYGLRRALNGDEEAWTALVEEFSATIWHWARSQGLDREEAGDVAQMVWFKLKDRGMAIREPRGLPLWLATTTKREARAMKKRRDREIPTVDQYDSPTGGAATAWSDPYQQARLSELQRSLANGFAELSDRCRELLTMCWDDTLSYQDIADALGTSVGYIGPTRKRCLEQLRTRAGV